MVVGLGSIGKRHVRILKKQCPQAEIAVLRHRSCCSSDIDTFGLADCYTTIEEALRFKPQVAIVANPASKHLEVANQLATAGIHLLVEKPIADSSSGIKDLVDLCHQRQCTLMVAYNLRFTPSLIEFRRLIQSGIVGSIYSVRAEVGQYLPSWRPETDYRNTVSSQRRLGGGVLLELSHEIDYLTWIFGPAQWVKAHVAKSSGLNIDVEDTVNTIIGLQGKSGCDVVATLNMDFIRHDTKRQCVVIGEKGSLLWDGIEQKVFFFPQNGHKWKALFHQELAKDYTYEQEIEHFLNAIKTDQKPLISGNQGLDVVLTVEAIRHSSKTGTTVSL